MHLDVNVVKMFNTLRMQCGRIDKLLSLKKCILLLILNLILLLLPSTAASKCEQSVLVDELSIFCKRDDQITHKSAPYFRLF